MKSLAVLLSALLFCPIASACESSISGAWVSDGPRTMDFARDNTKLEPRQESFLAALMGNMTIEFDGKQMHLRMPDLKVPVNGELRSFAGFDEQKSYEVLFSNCRTVVIASTDPGGKVDVSTYYFEGTDEMWVYTGSNAPAVPDLHMREYFRRIH